MGIGKDIGIRRIRWSEPIPAWKHAQAWRARRKAMREKFETINFAMSGALVGAQTNLSTGLAELAIRARIKSVQEQAADAAERLDKIQIDKIV